jgi:glucose-6-phosphate-specific signal transduction histidine kinase
MSKQGSRWVEASRHVAVALIYALGFVALRQISFSHWVLFAGFRLCALLLVPYRYWPALVVGEMAPLAVIAFSHSERYGALWSVLYVFPPIALAMPVVRWCRHSLGLFDSRGHVQVLTFLFCTLICAALWTAINLITLSETKFPANYPQLGYTIYAARWFIGNFLGVLTIAPLVLCAKELRADGIVSLKQLLSNSLVIEVLSVVFPSLMIFIWLCLSTDQDSLRQACRMGMFLPVVWMSLRHGWHGAALGGAAASVAIVLTMPERYDAGTLQAQVFMAFAITTMLLLGNRIAMLDKRESSGRSDARMALALAQRNMILGEMQLRQTSDALEHVREGVQATYSQLLDRLRHMLPVQDERDYRLRAAVTQQQLFRLADSLHPVVWREGGLAAALRQGAIARALDDSDIRYWCNVRDQGVDQISNGAQVALYRSACDLIAHLCESARATSVGIQVKVGRDPGSRWIFLKVEGVAGEAARQRVKRDDLLLRLSSSGGGVDAVRDRIALYRGELRSRETQRGQCISILMHDVAIDSVVI